MNKKGFFISLIAVIILTIVVFAVSKSFSSDREMTDIRIDYIKQKSASDYMDYLESDFLPSAVQTSLKSAFKGLSELKKDGGSFDLTGIAPDDYMQFEKLVKDGAIEAAIDEIYMPDANTLSLLLESSIQTLADRQKVQFDYFDYEIASIGQKDPFTIHVESNVKFKIIYEAVSRESDLHIVSDIPLTGLYHPGEGQYINDYWEAKNSQPCYLSFLDADIDCLDAVGICHYTGCII